MAPATAGSDYTSASGTLTFNAGDTTKTFNVPITDDDVSESNENMNLTLSNAINARCAPAPPPSPSLTPRPALTAPERHVSSHRSAARLATIRPGDGSPQTGDLSVHVPLDFRKSPLNSSPNNDGTAAMQPALVYNSDTVTAKPIVETTFQIQSSCVKPCRPVSTRSSPGTMARRSRR